MILTWFPLDDYVQEQYMVDKLAGIGVNITWPPVDGALPAPRAAAHSREALDVLSQPSRQVSLVPR